MSETSEKSLGKVQGELKEVKRKLKECKDEWLEKNAKGQPALGVLTVQQILDHAVEGVTDWNFVIEEQWREEVSKFNKNQGSYFFDGYVYHVRGYIEIKGLGRRAQFGSKVAVGGKDNQNSSYKSAASDCLKKCASLFGVGANIYSKIRVETEEEQYTQPADQNQYQQQQYQQPQQPQQPQQFQHPDGAIQQGEWVWVDNQQWIHQNDYHARLQQQQQQQPPQPQQPQQQGIAYDPAFAEPDLNAIEYPFENVPEKGNSQNSQSSENFQAQPQGQEATPQGEVQEQNYQATSYGAPAAQTATAEKPKQEADPMAGITAENPWDTPANQEQITLFQQHRKRLNIENDAHLLPHVRDYFKDGKASIASVTPETLAGFNAYLQNIQA